MSKKFRLGKRGTAALNVFLALVLVVSLAPSASVFATNDALDNLFAEEVNDEGVSDEAAADETAADVAAQADEAATADEAAADEATDATAENLAGGGASEADSGVSALALNASTQSAEEGVAVLANSEAAAGDTAQLATILDKDSAGNNAMYTTLYDADGKVVSTNDPTKTQDAEYAAGKTVAKGQELIVHFRIASVTPNNADGAGTGVQNATTYTMTLPTQLTPAATDAEGTKIVDPDTPLVFFNSGDIEATGGIYTQGVGAYMLKMNFSDVTDRVDISGEYQFTVKVSDGLEGGTTVEANYEPAGTVSFNVEKDPTPEPVADYTLKLEGASAKSSAATASDLKWTATAATTKDSFDYKTLELSLPEGAGFQVDSSEHAYKLTIGEQAYEVSAAGGTITFGNGAVLTLSKNDALSSLTSADGNTYVTQKATLTLPDGITAKEVKLEVPSLAYDDYSKLSDTNYSGTAKLTNGPSADVTAEGAASANYAGFGAPSISTNAENSNPAYSYENLPEKVETKLQSQTSSYLGNYYWMEFDPATTNTANANYYISKASFMPGTSASLSADATAGNDATFTTQLDGTKLVGNTTLDGWTLVGTCGMKGIQDGSSFGFFGNSANDVKLKYQLQKVFASADASGAVVVYRSNNQYNGKYAYLVVDSETTATAQGDERNGWSSYIEGFQNSTSGSKKAGTWKIHVFNAPATQFVASMYQHLGAFNSNDYDGDGKSQSGAPGTITDAVNTGIYSTGNQTNTSTYGFTHPQATLMRATYMSDYTIFWQMTFNAEQLASWSSGEFVVALGQGMYMSGGDTYTIDGSQLQTQSLYIKNKGGGWDSIASGYSNYGRGSQSNPDDLNNGTYQTSLDTTGMSAYNYTYSLSGLDSYRGADFEGLVTVGFFTYANSTPSLASEGYKCSAEMIAQMGDASVLAGSGGSAFPTSVVGNYALASYRLSATGYAPTPTMLKSSSLADSNTVEWVINQNNGLISSKAKSSLVSNYLFRNLQGSYKGYQGYYSGNLVVVDDMKTSEVKTLDGTKLEGVNAGKYVHVTRMFSQQFTVSEQTGGCGGSWIPYLNDDGTLHAGSSWYKFVSGAWVSANSTDTCWKPTEPGIYRHNIQMDGKDKWLYVYYSGNMYDAVSSALSSELSQLYNQGCEWLSSRQLQENANTWAEPLIVQYVGVDNFSTSTTPISYQTQLDEKALTAAANEAAGVSGDIESISSTFFVSMTNQANTGTAKKTGGITPSSATRSQRTTAALSINKSVGKVDVTSEKSKGDTGEYTLQSQVGQTATKYVSLEDYITGYTDVTMDKNYAQKEGNKYTLTDNLEAVKALASNLDVDLKGLTITASSAFEQGGQTVYSDGKFVNGWTGTTPTKDATSATKGKDSLLFFTKIMKEDGSDIPAGTVFTVKYKMRVVMDAETSKDTGITYEGFRSSDYYTGGALKIANSAIAERPYETVSGNSTDSISLLSSTGAATGEIKDGTLRVWPEADIDQVYLTPLVVIKTIIGIDKGDDATTTSWLFYDWTGMQGKKSPTLSIEDRPEFTLGAGLYTGEDAEQKSLALATIMAKHFTLKDVNVYLTDEENMPEADGKGGTNLTSDELIGQFTGEITKDATTRDARSEKMGKDLELKLTYEEPGSYIDEETGETKFLPAGFEIEGQELGFHNYFASTYDLVFDQAGFIKEAQEAGLLNDLGLSPDTNKSPEVNLVNKAVDADGHEASSPAKIEVNSATFGKTIDSEGSDPTSGTVNWVLTGNTGAASGDVVFTDSLDFTGDYVAAVKKATTLEVTSVTVGGEDVTDKATVEIDGASLKVTVSDVASNKEVVVKYTSTLDTDKYITAVIEAGGTAEEAVFTIENSAAMNLGESSLTDSKEQEVTPDTSIDADKTAGEVTADLTGIHFTAVGSANDVARTGFTMVDAVTADQNAQDALKVTALDATVTLADGTETTYTAEQLLAGVEGYALTTAEGDEFALNTPGVYDWKLVADNLPAGATITVNYTVAVDAATYKDIDGALLNGVINLSNKLSVSADDGATASDEAAGKVSVKPDVYKLGTDAGTTESGHNLIQWTVDVNLTTVFDAETLAKLQTASIKDKLDSRLKADLDSVKVVDLEQTVESTTEGAELVAGTDYEVTLADDNTFMVTLKNPAEHPNIRVYVTTEVLGGFDDLSNSVDLVIDGKSIGGDTYDGGDVFTVAEYGFITSSTLPVWNPVAKKTVDAAAPGEGKTFTFVAEEVADAQGTPLAGGTKVTATNDGEGAVTFGSVHYNKRNAEGGYNGTHYYKIYEDPTSVDANWYDYDSTSYIVEVDVAKGADGNYTATSTILSSPASEGATTDEGAESAEEGTNAGDGTETAGATDEGDNAGGGTETAGATEIAFNNTSKKASGTSAAFSAKKVLNGATLAADQFTFDLKDADGNVLQSVKNDADGAVEFEAISYDAEGIYNYTIAEQAGSAEGYTYDTTPRAVKVVVANTAENKLAATVTYDGASATPTFTNGYTTDATSVNLVASKVLSGANIADYAGKFSFDLKDASGKVVETATNGKDGSVAFSELSFEAAGTYNYTITEVAGSLDGITYSDKEVKVAITVTDDGAGKLSAAVSYDDATTTPVFTNAKKAEGTSATFTAKKVLNGATLAADQFTFDLKDADGNVLQSVKNAADGTVAFAAIDYSEEGTYNYTIAEQAGSAEGYTYDTTPRAVKVVVANTAENKLAATVTYDGAEAAPTITNTYNASATNVTLVAKKALEGANLADYQGKFSFELKDADGKVIDTVTNGEDGNISFKQLSFDAAGTYEYTISEVKGDLANVTYTDKVVKVVVTVNDDGSGKLKAALSYDGEQTVPVLTNTYTDNGGGKSDDNTGGNGGKTDNNSGGKTNNNTSNNTNASSKKAGTATGDATGMQVGLLAALAAGALALAGYARRGSRAEAVAAAAPAVHTRSARVQRAAKHAARPSRAAHAAHAQAAQAMKTQATDMRGRTQATCTQVRTASGSQGRTYAKHAVHKRR